MGTQPPAGSRCCCTGDKKYCRSYPQELLMRHWFLLNWKYICPYLGKEADGRQCARKDEGAKKECPKTSHEVDASCQDGRGSALVFEGKLCPEQRWSCLGRK